MFIIINRRVEGKVKSTLVSCCVNLSHKETIN